VDVVLGPFFTHRADIEAAHPTRLHQDPVHMCRLMHDVDLAVTGGGQTPYELAATQTPALGIQLGDDQRLNLQRLEEAGVLRSLGQADDPGLEARYKAAVGELVDRQDLRRSMSEAGRRLVDGQGASRVAETIVSAAHA
jgi:spore coat polysaccharide biosynthesis predicted glycosyltransferase SpsG